MPLRTLDAFYQERRRCDELDGNVEGDRVWMTCSCGALLNRALEPPAVIDRLGRAQHSTLRRRFTSCE